MTYRIVESPSPNLLEEKVRAFIGWGFVPLGGVSVVRFSRTDKEVTTYEYKYVQAVLKDEPSKPEKEG